MTIDLEPFRGLAIFSGLSNKHLERIAAVLRPKVTGGGTQILAEGERTTSLFILARGRVSTTKRLGLAVHGQADVTKQKLLVHIDAPQVFGEIALLSDQERSATVTAATECELFELRREDFELLAADDLAFGFQFTRNIAVVLAERLRRTDRDVLNLTAALSLSLGNR
jgi:CRP/FNR family cyclic AMP-dependent transcriptional regulator